MRWRAHTRAALFFAYTSFFIAVPLTILFGSMGLAVGTASGIAYLLFLRRVALPRIDRKLGAVPLSRAEAPALYASLQELCRRLEIPTIPRLYTMPSESLNLAAYGFSRADTRLVLTRGLTERLARDEISALLARKLCEVRSGDTRLGTWQSAFLGGFDRWITPSKRLSLRVLLRQIVLYPLALVSMWLLQATGSAKHLDLQATKVSRLAGAMVAALRKIEAQHLRLPLLAPFSVRHLFLVSPPSGDALFRVLFAPAALGERIVWLEKSTLSLVDA